MSNLVPEVSECCWGCTRVLRLWCPQNQTPISCPWEGAYFMVCSCLLWALTEGTVHSFIPETFTEHFLYADAYLALGFQK